MEFTTIRNSAKTIMNDIETGSFLIFLGTYNDYSKPVQLISEDKRKYTFLGLPKYLRHPYPLGLKVLAISNFFGTKWIELH